jgi:hypothetical protein
MVPALINLVIVLIVLGVLYWALNKLWPLGGEATASWIGQVVYVILIVVGVLALVFYGVLPVVEAIPGALGGGHFR